MAKQAKKNHATTLTFCKSVHTTPYRLLSASSKSPKVHHSIPVNPFHGRGSVSNYLPGVENGSYTNGISVDGQSATGGSGGGGAAKGGQSPQASNPYWADTCYMPFDHDRLIVQGNLMIVGGARKPNSCNNRQLYALLEEAATRYAELSAFQVLAERYCANLLNGAMLWRNQTLSCGVSAEITDLADQSVVRYGGEDTKPLSVTALDLPETPEVATLVKKIEAALAGKRNLRLSIMLTANMMPGSEVFPSQVFSERKTSVKVPEAARETGKLLVSAPDGCALMTPGKAGAAIRCVDNWFPEASTPIPAEPYGFHHSAQDCFRLECEGQDHPVGTNLYQLLAHADTDVYEPLQKARSVHDVPNDIHYFMAVLVRGGLFQNIKSK